MWTYARGLKALDTQRSIINYFLLGIFGGVSVGRLSTFDGHWHGSDGFSCNIMAIQYWYSSKIKNKYEAKVTTLHYIDGVLIKKRSRVRCVRQFCIGYLNTSRNMSFQEVFQESLPDIC